MCITYEDSCSYCNALKCTDIRDTVSQRKVVSAAAIGCLQLVQTLASHSKLTDRCIKVYSRVIVLGLLQSDSRFPNQFKCLNEAVLRVFVTESNTVIV